MGSELSCQELVELVTDHFEGRLADDERMRFDDHLAVCEGCRNYLEQMRETIRLTGAVNEESISPEGREALLLAFRDWRTRTP